MGQDSRGQETDHSLKYGGQMAALAREDQVVGNQIQAKNVSNRLIIYVREAVLV